MDDASRRLSPSGFMQLCEDEDEIRRFSQDQIVFREGDACDGLYVPLSGKFKIFTAANNGRELPVPRLRHALAMENQDARHKQKRAACARYFRASSWRAGLAGVLVSLVAPACLASTPQQILQQFLLLTP